MAKGKNIALARLLYSSMFLALGLLLPFLTMQIPTFGSALCPMHFAVLLCGFAGEEGELAPSVEQIGVDIRALSLRCCISCGNHDELAFFDVPFLFQFLIRGAENSSHAGAHDRFSESC